MVDRYLDMNFHYQEEDALIIGPYNMQHNFLLLLSYPYLDSQGIQTLITTCI